VDRLFGLKDVAQLTFLLTIGSVLQLLTTALNQVWSPRFYRLVHSNADGAAIERLNRRFYSYQSWGLGAFAAACLAGMPLLLDFAGGQLSNYRDMRLEMWLIFSGYIILVLWTHCQNYLLVYDKGNLLMHVVLITSLIGVAVWIPLMLLLGPIGIYLGFFFHMLVRTLGIIIAARKWHLRLCWASTAGAIVLAAIPILFPIA
jgi:O-antigen/teichoic acid export membrane protein